MIRKVVACLTLLGLAAPAASSATPLEHVSLPDGRSALVEKDGVAQIWSADRRTLTYRRIRPALVGEQRYGERPVLPPKDQILDQLRSAPPRSYARDEVLVQFLPGVTATRDRFDVPADIMRSVRRAGAVPEYTSDVRVNRALARLGADRSVRFAKDAYRVHLTGASVAASVAALRAVGAVRYASPNWLVSTMRAPAIAIPRRASEHARAASLVLARSAVLPEGGSLRHEIPTNYAVSASAQSLLNAPGVDAIAAFDEVSRAFHQLPGQGEIITNVSLGDLTDASAVSPPSHGRGGTSAEASSGKGKGGGGGGGDPCAGTVTANGPTTVVVGRQRYLNWPSMPLVPTYVSDASGRLSGSAEVCNSTDQGLGEVGLDFSVMAPLPHALQRSSDQGTGFTDLLGIAPGASYRLVVPGNPSATIADIDAALLGAAAQNPRPNVITASLGFGFDAQGFPGRYLEEDPLTHAIVSSIVSEYGIVVCIAAGDGLRAYTNAAIAPSGGSAATNLAAAGTAPTDLNDVAYSTAPSTVVDSGAIDAGGTTLNDIFAAPPQDPRYAAFSAQLAFPVTRYDGDTTFSSGFGTRVNVSAPADNIAAMSHAFGFGADTVDVFLEGGTSASAPESAAAAAVALQVARLTGHPFGDARAVRAFLSDTGTMVPGVPQTDVPLQVGRQIDLTNVVETLLHHAGMPPVPSVARVAVAQRRSVGVFDGAFVSDTNATAIDLQGPLDANNVPTGNDQLAWITIAPDWEGLSPQARFTLSASRANGRTGALATTRWARLLPSEIFRAAGLPPASSSSRSVTLRYEARDRGRSISTPVTLTFGPGDGTSTGALAPLVDGEVRGNRIAVTYDLSRVRNVTSPEIVVSLPGRINPATGYFFNPKVVERLPSVRGTFSVPIDRLEGDGIYGIALGLRNDPSGGVDVSDFAYTHVLQALHNTHASAPLLSTAGSAPGHVLEIPYNGSFTVSWDVSSVPAASGALLEISAPGPTGQGVLNPFNNPGGTIRDRDGIDFGSVYATTVSGPRGAVTLHGGDARLVPTMNHVVRVIPLTGSLPAAEASDVSTLLMDGVAPADGGTLEDGYAINATGNDGFFTSTHIAGGTFGSSVDTFEQSTAAVRPAATSPTDAYLTTGSGVWGGDFGIVGDVDLSISGSPPSATSYRLLHPVATGTFGAPWQPPVLADGVSRIVQTAPNPRTAEALALSGDPLGSSTLPYRVFTSDLATGTFGPAYNVSAALPANANAFAIGLAQDSARNLGFVAFANFAAQCGAPQIAGIDLANGKIALFSGPGSGFPLDLAVDPATHLGVYQTQCDNMLNLFDLASHQGVSAPLPGQAGLYNAVDPVHHLIAVEMAAGASPISNNNAMSAVFIYDERGQLLETLEKFNFYGIGLVVNANNLQVNSTTRTGFMFGPGAAQLEPFHY